MKLVFISGPFRANSTWEVEQNIRKAEELALEYWRQGYAVICPHTNTRFFQGALEDDVWLKGDIEILKRCDAIAFVEGWEMSEGSREEYQLAIKSGLEILNKGQVKAINTCR